MNEHPIPDECRGERCAVCREQAHHKVGEVFLASQTALEPSAGDLFGAASGPVRHNLTAYLCCRCFRAVMGGAGTPWCLPKEWELDPEFDRNEAAGAREVSGVQTMVNCEAAPPESPPEGEDDEGEGPSVIEFPYR
jgi:hypothetical protein